VEGGARGQHGFLELLQLGQEPLLAAQVRALLLLELVLQVRQVVFELRVGERELGVGARALRQLAPQLLGHDMQLLERRRACCRRLHRRADPESSLQGSEAANAVGILLVVA
jgi:hypothetical protein